jgi:microcystin degradation protein MlrC
VDGVLLVLHGAMMAEGEPDATGAILEAVRAVVGPQVPVVGTLDLHANVTARMVHHATALVGYHTAPHIDLYETGRKAAHTMLVTLRGEYAPTMALVRLPMLIPGENARHTDGPLAEVIHMAEALEQAGMVLHAGIYPVQPWLDTEDVGCAVVAITNGDQAAAQEHARTLAEAFWARRDRFVPELVPPDEAVRRALARDEGMVVLCDSADSPTSGSTGDSTVILQAVLRAAPLTELALLNVVDPEVVAQAVAAGVGHEVTVQIGGKLAPAFFAPVTFKGYVKLISDGVFYFKGPGMRGMAYRMGRTVVLTQGGIHLVVMERPVSQWDPQLYRSLGEEPTDARIVQVKSPAAFRAAYGPLACDILIVASPGPATPAFTTLPWQHLRRPIYPLDPDTRWP